DLPHEKVLLQEDSTYRGHSKATPAPSTSEFICIGSTRETPTTRGFPTGSIQKTTFPHIHQRIHLRPMEGKGYTCRRHPKTIRLPSTSELICRSSARETPTTKRFHTGNLQKATLSHSHQGIHLQRLHTTNSDEETIQYRGHPGSDASTQSSANYLQGST
ncbi:hypothetical protein HHI36_017074, partial [Cryptolaemus montrouzieri]